jgi:protein-tyrosine phosphatase
MDVSSKDRLLVHDYFGQSRAPTIVIAWLIHRRRFTVSQALTLLADRHKKCQPVCVV